MIDDELRVLLSGEPSPGFEARVRTRVKADRAHTGWRGLRPGMLAIAATIAAAVVIGLLPRMARQSESPHVASSIAGGTAALPAVAPNVDATLSVAARSGPAVRSRARKAPAIATLVDTHAAVAQIQVDRAESLALQRLFASPVSGTVVDVAPSPMSELVIPPIAIEPLTLDIRSEGVSQ